MPQFDFFSFFLQLFLVILSFLIFYFFNMFYVLKSVVEVLKIRIFFFKFRSKSSAQEQKSSVNYTYIMRKAFQAVGYLK